MRNLNEGKKKASAYMAELAEIDKQSAVVAMEAKINKLAEMVEAKTQRLSMVSEDENLSELIDKKRVKMMEREIKEIERAKLKLEKLYEKMTGGKKKEVVDEEMDDKINPGNTEDDQAKKDAYDYDARPSHMKEGGYGSTTYEEDDSTYEEDDMKESTNEEYLRMQKLAGVISEEEYKNRLNEEESTGKTINKMVQNADKLAKSPEMEKMAAQIAKNPELVKKLNQKVAAAGITIDEQEVDGIEDAELKKLALTYAKKLNEGGDDDVTAEVGLGAALGLGGAITGFNLGTTTAYLAGTSIALGSSVALGPVILGAAAGIALGVLAAKVYKKIKGKNQ